MQFFSEDNYGMLSIQVLFGNDPIISPALLFWIAVVGEDSPTVGYCGSAKFHQRMAPRPQKGCTTGWWILGGLGQGRWA